MRIGFGFNNRAWKLGKPFSFCVLSRVYSSKPVHVYPRECPYPHVSGTTDAKLPEEWKETSGEDGTATKEEMNAHISKAGSATEGLIDYPSWGLLYDVEKRTAGIQY